MANDNRAWYEDIFMKGLLRSSGTAEIVESNPLDWERLRVWDNGKLVPVMPRGHIGVPSDMDLEWLRSAAEKGNLFLYRMGDIYPQRMDNGIWYSTDPAVVSAGRPELHMPPPPKVPEPLPPLEDELRAKGIDPKKRQTRDFATPDEWLAYDAAVQEYRQKKIELHKAQLQYRQDMDKYSENVRQVQQRYDVDLRAWQAKNDVYSELSDEIRNAIRTEAPQRREQIMRNQEAQQAARADREPLMNWYQNEFRRSMVRPSGAPDLVESEGMDWGRVRIWDGEKFARAMPDGHKGSPSTEQLLQLRNAAERGNLFMYQQGGKYPSKWMGNHWRSMDREWIESCKPTEPVMPEAPERQAVPAGPQEPKLEDFTKNISGRKLATNAFFRTFGLRVYDSTRDEYNLARAQYELAKRNYDQEAAEHARVVAENEKQYADQLETYNNEVEARRNDYNHRMANYESMRRSYENLTYQQQRAMEQDVQAREEEIRHNREIENQRGRDAVANEQIALDQVNGVQNRMDVVGQPQPQQENFLNFGVNGQPPLGQEAYNAIAPHGYNLPPDSRITPAEAAAIHIALAGSSQAAMNGGLPPLAAGQYGQMLGGMLYGKPSAVDWQYMAASYDAARDYIGAYEGGDPKPLAQALGQGLRNLNMLSNSQMDMTPETAGIAQVAGRILSVLDQHKDLRDNCGLRPEELEYARGTVALGQIYNNYIEAQMELKKLGAGLNQLSQEDRGKYMGDIMLGQLASSRMRVESGMQNELGMPMGQFRQAIAKGNALNVVQNIYRKDDVLNNYINGKKPNEMNEVDKNMQDLAKIFGNSPLAKPRTSMEMRMEIRNQIRENLQKANEGGKARGKAEISEEVDQIERQQVRFMMAQENPMYRTVGLKDPRVSQKLDELRAAREALEAEANKSYVNDKQSETLYELNDPLVQEEAITRASVREFMRRELRERRGEDVREEDFINDFTVGRRVSELRQAQQQLRKEGNTPELLSNEVVQKAAENRQSRGAQRREEREETLRREIAEKVRVQRILGREMGYIDVDRNITDEARLPAYNSREVEERMNQLRAARESLMEEKWGLELTDPRVIARDYERRGINPVTYGIQDPGTMTKAQQQEYHDRMDTIDYLTAQGVQGLNKEASRGDERVTSMMVELRRGRNYALAVNDDPSLATASLNDPKVIEGYNAVTQQIMRAQQMAAGMGQNIPQAGPPGQA